MLCRKSQRIALLCMMVITLTSSHLQYTCPQQKKTKPKPGEDLSSYSDKPVQYILLTKGQS